MDLTVCNFADLLDSGDSEVTFTVFESSCHLLLPVQPPKGNLVVKCLAQGHSKRTCRRIFPLYPFSAERQVEKLWIPTF